MGWNMKSPTVDREERLRWFMRRLRDTPRHWVVDACGVLRLVEPEANPPQPWEDCMCPIVAVAMLEGHDCHVSQWDYALDLLGLDYDVALSLVAAADLDIHESDEPYLQDLREGLLLACEVEDVDRLEALRQQKIEKERVKADMESFLEWAEKAQRHPCLTDTDIN